MEEKKELLTPQVAKEVETETKEMPKFYEVKGTPFTIMKRDEGYTILLGNNILTKPFRTKMRAKFEIWRKPYYLIMTACNVYLKIIKDYEGKRVQPMEEDTSETAKVSQQKRKRTYK